MSASNQHSELRDKAWSRIDTTKTEDMVSASELRGWLARYVDLVEQHDALRRAIEDMGDHVVALERIGKRALGIDA